MITKIPYRVAISEKHRDMLKKLAESNRRTLQGQLEILIEEASND